jgi:hypothetical protein
MMTRGAGHRRQGRVDFGLVDRLLVARVPDHPLGKHVNGNGNAGNVGPPQAGHRPDPLGHVKGGEVAEQGPLLAGDDGQAADGQLLDQGRGLLVEAAGGEGGPVRLAVPVPPDEQGAPAVEVVVAGERLDPNGAAGQRSRRVALAPQFQHAAVRRDAVAPRRLDGRPPGQG